MYSNSINQLIEAFKQLPTVGQKTAERFVFHLLKSGKKPVTELIEALSNLSKTIKSCQSCWDFTDQSPCQICSNQKRNVSLLCIVAQPADIQAIEKTGQYNGLYFVLRGLINLEQKNLAGTKIKELLIRALGDKNLKEIILALNSDMEGETTSMYIQKQLKKSRPSLLTSRLARGLPMGSDLQYADEITLSAAILNRNR